MGHAHAHISKIDPGTDVLEMLRQRWLHEPHASTSAPAESAGRSRAAR
jgi:hypothetical protein